MKNTVITARRKKIELLTLLACFIIEMLTSIFYVLAFSCVLYAFWTLLRLLFYGIRNLFLKKKSEV